MYATNGMVASSQPLATAAGLEMLRMGGTAVDAAVATAAMLCVVEPGSTDLGGDFFMLYYDRGRVAGVNGSGKSAADQPIVADWTPTSALCVTVPGCVAAWCDAHRKFGRLRLKDVLSPAIRAAKAGFPIAPLALAAIRAHRDSLPPDFLADAQRAGDVVRRPDVAAALEAVAAENKRGFYRGRVAEAIVEAVKSRGGHLSLQDLAQHQTLMTKPLCVDFRGVRVWEHAPNAAGIVALLALNTLQHLSIDFSARTPQVIHCCIEALRYAFADGRDMVCDPDNFVLGDALSKDWGIRRANDIDVLRATAADKICCLDYPRFGPDTVSFQVVDSEGRAVSAVNSTYMSFGSKIVSHGFTLQNRGYNFVLGQPKHPNAVGPSKRPYHTILPCIVTDPDTDDLLATLTNMGGFVQPQGHVQHVLNLFCFGLDPQASVDAPRFALAAVEDDCRNMAAEILVEPGFGADFLDDLRRRGHILRVVQDDAYARGCATGKAQIIARCPRTGVLVAGSDPRADGAAMGF